MHRACPALSRVVLPHALIVGILLVLGVTGEPRPTGADIGIVVRLRPRAESAAPALAVPERLRSRIAVRRRFTDRLPAFAPRPGVTTRPAPGGAGNPFDLDPSNVWLFTAPDTATADSVLRALAASRDVAWAELDAAREPALERYERIGPLGAAGHGAGFPDDPLFVGGYQWGLENLGPDTPAGGVPGADIAARAAWRLCAGAPGLRIAVADTGIDPEHPEFRGPSGAGPRITAAINITDDPDSAWRDTFGHGTPVAGVVAASTGDGAHFDSLGIAGVCGGDGAANPGCTIVPIRITRGAGGAATSFDIARAIVHAVHAGARAVNVSFTGNGPSRLEREALYYAITRGCVVVAAAGNRGATAPRAPQYPAAYAADGLCIQVGASDPWDRRTVFSSYGPGLDVLAPGTGIWTTFMTYPSAAGASYGGYLSASGTSFAAPFATGVVGLLAAARPELADADFQQLLRAGARDLGASGPDEATGWGRLDAARSLAAVGPEVGVWHEEVAATMWVERDADTLVAGESGPGDLTPGAWAGAVRVEARATVAVPDSFLPGWRVWPRVGGTMSLRGDFRVPHFAPAAAIVARDERSFTLAGWSYRIDGAGAGGGPLYVPLPPDQTRFGFTVLGAVARPAATVARDARPRRIAVTPNPFRAFALVHAPPDAVVEVFDPAGRRVRRLAADGSVGPRRWDGADDRGRPLPQGLYLIRGRSDRGVMLARALKLE